MSLSTLIRSDDDFDEWEQEFTQPMGEPLPGPQPTFRPSRAAERREAREVIDRELGYNRHRSTEREA